MPLRLALLAGALLLSGCGEVVAIAVGARTIAPGAVAGAGGVDVVDLREPAEFAAARVPGAVNVPALGLDRYLAGTPARPRPLVLVCAHGTLAVLASPSARLYRADVRVLEGGMEGWRRAGLATEAGPPAGAAGVASEAELPFRALSRLEQLVACASGCFLKPLYLALAFWLVRLLGRGRTAALRLLRHGLLWFFAGEVLCAANFYLHRPGLVFPIELLHGLGMVAMSALVPWGLWRLADERVLHLDDPAQGCTLQRLCGRCWKRDPVRCGIHDLMIPVVAGLALLALMPLSAPLRPTMFRTDILGSTADYGEPILNHLVELRLYPAVAAGLFLSTLPLVLRARPGSLRRAEPLFFAAVGFATYPVLRNLLANAYREALPWSDFWEELTELLLVGTLAFFLLRFRGALGLAPGARFTPEAAPAAAPPQAPAS